MGSSRPSPSIQPGGGHGIHQRPPAGEQMQNSRAGHSVPGQVSGKQKKTEEALGTAREAEVGHSPGSDVRGRGPDQPPTQPWTTSRLPSPPSAEEKPHSSCRKFRYAVQKGVPTRRVLSRAQAQPGGGDYFPISKRSGTADPCSAGREAVPRPTRHGSSPQGR
ncbi:hypothetical protein NDU88_004400 [Pleurodeles waltl]|uniref:Uncharacterized protein n=1 Tax=Pleurodeles waltl TaxID=8319 RepID=A0AAV7LQV1_PLEWA|nr:hypothetical protein NDU88_004400 [Pleurodeles waltl]